MSSFDSKHDIKALLKESIEELIQPLKEEIEKLSKSVNHDIKINYLSTISRVLAKEAEETINSFTCAYDINTGLECKSLIKETIANYTSALAVGDIANALNEIKDMEKIARQNAFDPNRSPKCNNDWRTINKILSRHKEIIHEISANFTHSKVPNDISELDFDPETLYKDIIFPFSHPIRLQIMYALKSGSKRFTLLKNELNVKNTGLLVHHLKPLTESGYVIQDHRKQYSLSEKGYTIIRYFSQLQDIFKPEEFEITMQPFVVLRE